MWTCSRRLPKEEVIQAKLQSPSVLVIKGKSETNHPSPPPPPNFIIHRYSNLEDVFYVVSWGTALWGWFWLFRLDFAHSREKWIFAHLSMLLPISRTQQAKKMFQYSYLILCAEGNWIRDFWFCSVIQMNMALLGLSCIWYLLSDILPYTD